MICKSFSTYIQLKNEKAASTQENPFQPIFNWIHYKDNIFSAQTQKLYFIFQIIINLEFHGCNTCSRSWERACLPLRYITFPSINVLEERRLILLASHVEFSLTAPMLGLWFITQPVIFKIFTFFWRPIEHPVLYLSCHTIDEIKRLLAFFPTQKEVSC